MNAVAANKVDQDRRISEVFAREATRLGQFIRSRVSDVGVAEDISNPCGPDRSRSWPLGAATHAAGLAAYDPRGAREAARKPLQALWRKEHAGKRASSLAGWLKPAACEGMDAQVLLSPAHVAHRHRNLRLHAKLHPALLIVLQSIAWSFHLDHSVTIFFRPELNQIGQAAAIFV